ncbi:MAG: PilZ domain-containing protein [Calditrichaceae bacterium]|nr:PilZ domain-containing protein [Calditrichaceae bacterium]MBN2707573.1 PilZ domain-containing protein [Calditrichaceae bacterium]RQV95657.1 MAG: PilZ domain-containing protein [Calditrichota bacterium]
MDRRTLNRSEVPGTKVQYRRIQNKNFFQPLSNTVQMVNISKSGACIITYNNLKRGEIILLRIVFPDGKKLKLKGFIRWNSSDTEVPGYLVGVQFYPFGTSSNYNPIKALEYLRNISGQELEKFIPPESEDLFSQNTLN